MPLPPVAFYSIYEISARWGCPAADVAGWAVEGHLQVLAGIPPVSCGEEIVAGLVEVPIAELMPMFRRYGPSDEQCRLKRVKPLGSKTWLKVTDPADGLPIRSSDLLLAAGPFSSSRRSVICCAGLRRSAQSGQSRTLHRKHSPVVATEFGKSSFSPKTRQKGGPNGFFR